MKYVITVDVRDAREANAALKDARVKYKNDGSDVFVFKKEDDAEEAMDILKEAGIKSAEMMEESLSGIDKIITLCEEMDEVNASASARASFYKTLKDGELEDLDVVAKRVKVLMKKDNGLSLDDASKQAMRDTKKVDAKNLKKYMEISGMEESGYDDEKNYDDKLGDEIEPDDLEDPEKPLK